MGLLCRCFPSKATGLANVSLRGPEAVKHLKQRSEAPTAARHDLKAAPHDDCHLGKLESKDFFVALRVAVSGE